MRRIGHIENEAKVQRSSVLRPVVEVAVNSLGGRTGFSFLSRGFRLRVVFYFTAIAYLRLRRHLRRRHPVIDAEAKRAAAIDDQPASQDDEAV